MAKQLELFDTFQIKVKAGEQKSNAIISDSKDEVKSGYSLVCEIDATHAGTLINNRIYPPESMQKGIRSWTSPYKKPVLVNHDDTKDPIGRVISAKYFKTPRGSDMKEYKPVLRDSDGYGYQRLTVKITDPDAIQKILDGRYETVSVRMATDHAICSVCGSDWSGEDGPCDHTPGQKYDGKLAYMTTGTLNYREMSFVNIPADEYAGVKEAIISGTKDASELKMYASNNTEKVLADLCSGENLYAMVDSESEDSDGVVTFLLDKANKSKQIYKEEDVKLTELTKDQLKDLDAVKELIKEAVDANMVIAAKDLEDKMKKLKEDCIKNSAPEEEKAAEVPAEAAPETTPESAPAAEEKPAEEKPAEEAKPEIANAEASEDDSEDAKKKKKEAEEKKKKEPKKEEEEEEDKKKKKKVSPAENKGKGKSGGSKHGAGNQSPVGEDPGDSVEISEKEKELEDSSSKVLDENVKINAELHKMVAERLYDLKKTLRKPDVVGISTPDARDKKVEEFAQRSIDSLKDQIKDLLVEQDNALSAGFGGKDVEDPSISRSDLTNEVLEDKKKTKEGKQETLTRLFSKSK